LIYEMRGAAGTIPLQCCLIYTPNTKLGSRTTWPGRERQRVKINRTIALYISPQRLRSGPLASMPGRGKIAASWGGSGTARAWGRHLLIVCFDSGGKLGLVTCGGGFRNARHHKGGNCDGFWWTYAVDGVGAERGSGVKFRCRIDPHGYHDFDYL
jgi:hypothetical protein